LTIVISGFFASLAGLLTVYFTGVVLPDRAHLPSSILVVMAALIGGVTVLKGGLLGGVLMAFIISIASQYTFRYWTVVGTLFILVVMFLPNGFIGSDGKVKQIIESVFQNFKSKVLR
jgi:branched-chain amino acid transport system permease protein